ncbi:MAG: FKBP-type peptidyl-prolyl cis-trans isomerase [Brevundimonas sp.]|uniref:FKBP-type peptidyl-prolyl cis-trans isomerase n=1 Tax=Brevundimonas sp. TaxID=1871086 RepID=UPI00391B9E67
MRTLRTPALIMALGISALLGACASPAARAPLAEPVASSSPTTPEQWRAAQQAHLEWNRTRAGWRTTDSGLQYRRVSRAMPRGVSPVATDRVRVDYEGQLITGTVFDSSFARGESATFPLDRVIRGWTEGVQLMREGETFEFLIPADLAYGDRTIGDGLIPAGSALRFRVSLHEVNPAQE